MFHHAGNQELPRRAHLHRCKMAKQNQINSENVCDG
jgi:hypothetical protein